MCLINSSFLIRAPFKQEDLSRIKSYSLPTASQFDKVINLRLAVISTIGTLCIHMIAQALLAAKELVLTCGQISIVLFVGLSSPMVHLKLSFRHLNQSRIACVAMISALVAVILAPSKTPTIYSRYHLIEEKTTKQSCINRIMKSVKQTWKSNREGLLFTAKFLAAYTACVITIYAGYYIYQQLELARIAEIAKNEVAKIAEIAKQDAIMREQISATKLSQQETLNHSKPIEIFQNLRNIFVGREKSCKAIIFDGFPEDDILKTYPHKPFNNEIAKHCNTLVYEANNEEDFCKALKSGSESLGGKIDVLLLSGHGSSYSQVLGPNYNFQASEIETQCIKTYVKEDAHIISAGCGTARETSSAPSLARKIAQNVPKRLVSAPADSLFDYSSSASYNGKWFDLSGFTLSKVILPEREYDWETEKGTIRSFGWEKLNEIAKFVFSDTNIIREFYYTA